MIGYCPRHLEAGDCSRKASGFVEHAARIQSRKIPTKKSPKLIPKVTSQKVLVCKLSGVLFWTLFGVMRRENMCPHASNRDAGLTCEARNRREMNFGQPPFLPQHSWRIPQIPSNLHPTYRANLDSR